MDWIISFWGFDSWFGKDFKQVSEFMLWTTKNPKFDYL